MNRFLIIFCFLSLMSCGTDDGGASRKPERESCLNIVCERDSVPKVDNTIFTVLKRNGNWYALPRMYGGADGALAFYWPSKTPMEGAGGDFPERKSSFYDTAIEVFLFPSSDKSKKESLYQRLIVLDNQGRVSEKKIVKKGLELWVIKSDAGVVLDEKWYLATGFKDKFNEPPVILCIGVTKACTGGLSMNQDISVYWRFNARHASDWPNVYAEIVRVLNLIKRV